MMATEKMSVVGYNDAELVEWSLTGDREAFERIVERYQSLVCSITYGATGSLGLSEDIAQETFVTAWKQLPELHEPSKLRSWLCGIARCLIGKALRRDGREPVHAAEPLDAIHELPAPEPSPSAQAVSREEEAILWRALERIPDTYRQPLILFYREQQSVERVAEELELSEDAVKQRLSRGRKLLTEEVAAFVEGTLKRTTPGKAFTVGVLAALPLVATSAKAAAVGAAAAKGSATAKAAGLIGLVNMVLIPVMGVFGTWIGYKMSVDGARSEEERAFVSRFYRILWGCIVGFIVATLGIIKLGSPLVVSRPALWAGSLMAVSVLYILAVMGLTLWSWRHFRAFRRVKVGGDRVSTQATAWRWGLPAFEYQSKLSVLGLPLVHIRLHAGLDRGPVKAWIAAGDAAIGAIFAFGGLAVAPLSCGACSIGLLTFGGLAAGLLSMGGFSLGLWAMGAQAIGLLAFGGCAIGWQAAMGGVAIARDYALGGIALADQANNAVAAAFIRNHIFFRNAEVALQYLFWLTLLWFVPLVVWWRVVARRTRQSSTTP